MALRRLAFKANSVERMIRRLILLTLMLVSLFGLTACDSEPLTLMKASKQFESDEVRDHHVDYMRKNHMDALKHKRDETMYKGIRTEKNSINACINCHVPENYNGKVLRHTDQEHFCTTCHTYVAAKLDCFECHVDHPVKTELADNYSDFHEKIQDVTKLTESELITLAFKYSSTSDKNNFTSHNNVIKKATEYNDLKAKPHKSGGVSFVTDTQVNSSSSNKNSIKQGATNE